MSDSPTTLFSQTILTLRQTPWRMATLACVMGLLVGAFDVAQLVWPSVSKVTYFVGSCGAFMAWVVAEYAITMAMVDRRRSVYGLLVFVGINIARFFPILLALFLMFVFPKALQQAGSAAIILILILAGLAPVVMLPAWPIEQTQFKEFISPWRAFKATKGHRWNLLILAGLANSADRFVPTLTAIHDPVQITLAVMEKTVVYSFTNLITAAIAASAFLFAIKNDPSLAG